MEKDGFVTLQMVISSALNRTEVRLGVEPDIVLEEVLPAAGTVPADMVPVELRGRDRQVASKCDLCHESKHGPACVASCPPGCAFRVGSLAEIQDLIGE